MTIAAGGRDAVDDWVAATDLRNLTPATSVEVLDRTGELLHGFTVEDGLWRLKTEVGDVDPNYLAMLIGFEDQRFYDHLGVDFYAVLRAAFQAASSGEIVSGASTLTMQVARLLEDGPTGSLSGKLRQVRVALALEKVLSKEQILSMYLTLAPFGGNLEGLRAASLRYFGKPPKRLSAIQAALLVAIPQSPVARRPDINPKAALRASERVLERVGLSVKKESNLAKYYPFPQLSPHLSRRIKRSEPSRTVHQLTVDKSIQTKFEDLAKQTAAQLGAKTSVAFVAMDHRTGAVVASVGSADQNDTARDGYVDMTRALRSPGSTLKPLIYAMGFEAGLAHPDTIFQDRPVTFGSYAPQNFDGHYRGDILLRSALQQSLNTSAVALTNQIGPARLIAKIRQTGATPVIPSGKAGLAVALGGLGLSLQDLVTIYATLANQGKVVQPYWHMGYQPNGGARVLSEKSTWYVTDILRGVTPPAHAPRGVLAFKTGTSYGHRDAWAIGYDGEHVVGVWIGRPDGTPVPGAFGGDTAAPVLFQAFTRLKSQIVPFAAAPSNALIVSNSNLPRHLQRLNTSTGFAADEDAPKITFPPKNVKVAHSEVLTLKLRDGQAPFTWLVNGAPLEGVQHRRDLNIQKLSRGFHRFTVIDAIGRSASTRIELR